MVGNVITVSQLTEVSCLSLYVLSTYQPIYKKNTIDPGWAGLIHRRISIGSLKTEGAYADKRNHPESQ